MQGAYFNDLPHPVFLVMLVVLGVVFHWWFPLLGMLLVWRLVGGRRRRRALQAQPNAEVERRLSLLEDELSLSQREIQRLNDELGFYRKLYAGRSERAPESGGA
jgi:hypothetical protein